MKKLFILTILLISGLSQAQKAKLTVAMSGFKSDDGVVKVGLYNSEDTFLKTPLKSLVGNIKNQQAEVTFENLEAGEYAVSIYHDENNNGKLDKNSFGIPEEDFASSNNAKGFMGPPKYADAKFELKTDSKIKITINKK